MIIAPSIGTRTITCQSRWKRPSAWRMRSSWKTVPSRSDLLRIRMHANSSCGKCHRLIAVDSALLTGGAHFCSMCGTSKKSLTKKDQFGGQFWRGWRERSRAISQRWQAHPPPIAIHFEVNGHCSSLGRCACLSATENPNARILKLFP